MCMQVRCLHPLGSVSVALCQWDRAIDGYKSGGLFIKYLKGPNTADTHTADSFPKHSFGF